MDDFKSYYAGRQKVHTFFERYGESLYPPDPVAGPDLRLTRQEDTPKLYVAPSALYDGFRAWAQVTSVQDEDLLKHEQAAGIDQVLHDIHVEVVEESSASLTNSNATFVLCERNRAIRHMDVNAARSLIQADSAGVASAQIKSLDASSVENKGQANGEARSTSASARATITIMGNLCAALERSGSLWLKGITSLHLENPHAHIKKGGAGSLVFSAAADSSIRKALPRLRRLLLRGVTIGVHDVFCTSVESCVLQDCIISGCAEDETYHVGHGDADAVTEHMSVLLSTTNLPPVLSHLVLLYEGHCWSAESSLRSLYLIRCAWSVERVVFGFGSQLRRLYWCYTEAEGFDLQGMLRHYEMPWLEFGDERKVALPAPKIIEMQDHMPTTTLIALDQPVTLAITGHVHLVGNPHVGDDGSVVIDKHVEVDLHSSTLSETMMADFMHKHVCERVPAEILSGY